MKNWLKSPRLLMMWPKKTKSWQLRWTIWNGERTTTWRIFRTSERNKKRRIRSLRKSCRQRKSSFNSWHQSLKSMWSNIPTSSLRRRRNLSRSLKWRSRRKKKVAKRMTNHLQLTMVRRKRAMLMQWSSLKWNKWRSSKQSQARIRKRKVATLLKWLKSRIPHLLQLKSKSKRIKLKWNPRQGLRSEWRRRWKWRLK